MNLLSKRYNSSINNPCLLHVGIVSSRCMKLGNRNSNCVNPKQA